MKQFEKWFSDKNLFSIQTMDKKQVFGLSEIDYLLTIGAWACSFAQSCHL